jgi:hypothetical protein
MSLSYIIESKQLENKFNFLKLYIKLNQSSKEVFYNLDKLLFALHNIRQLAMSAMLSQL